MAQSPTQRKIQAGANEDVAQGNSETDVRTMPSIPGTAKSKDNAPHPSIDSVLSRPDR